MQEKRQKKAETALCAASALRYFRRYRPPILLYDTFKKLTEKFSDILVTIHRGTAVNMQYATAIENGALKLSWDDREAEFAYSKENYSNILSAIELIE